MGYASNGTAARGAHEALLARQDAELRLMEAMKRSLQAKMKSDREYALALSAAAAQGQKMDKCEELNGKNFLPVIVDKYFLEFLFRRIGYLTHLNS